MKGGIYFPGQISISGNETRGGIDICEILDAIHAHGFYFDDSAVNPVRPTSYSKVISCSHSCLYDDQPGIGSAFYTDTIADLDPDWDYNVYAVYQFALLSNGYPPYVPKFTAPAIPKLTLQASVTCLPTTKAVSKTGYAGQRLVGSFGSPSENIHSSYTLCDSFAWPKDVTRDFSFETAFQISFVDIPDNTTGFDVSFQAKFMVVVQEKP